MENKHRLQIAVVTGASSGMGRETVIQLADRFACLDEIWVLARREERLKQLALQVPVRLRSFAVDLTKEEELGELRDAWNRNAPVSAFLPMPPDMERTGQQAQGAKVMKPEWWT